MVEVLEKQVRVAEVLCLSCHKTLIEKYKPLGQRVRTSVLYNDLGIMKRKTKRKIFIFSCFSSQCLSFLRILSKKFP